MNEKNPEIEKLYKESLNKEDIELLNSLKVDTVYLEGNFYVSALEKMGFEIVRNKKDLSFGDETIRNYNKDYVIIKRDNKYGIASLVSNEIFLICEYDEIEREYDFEFEAFILTKGQDKYIYNLEKKVIMSKFKADSIISVLDGVHIAISINNLVSIYDISLNKNSTSVEYDEVLYYDERLIALVKDDIVTIFNYVNSKEILQYKKFSDDYYIENEELSYENIFVINKSNKLGLLDVLSGEIILDPEYDNIEFVECFGKRYMISLEKDNKFGLYNASIRKIIIEPICDYISLLNKSLKKYLFSFCIDNKVGFCTDKNISTNAIFTSIETDERGYFIICRTKNNYYVYNSEECLFSLKDDEKFEVILADFKKGIFKGTRMFDNEIFYVYTKNRESLAMVLTDFSILYHLENGYILKRGNDKYYIYLDEDKQNIEKLTSKESFESIEPLENYYLCYKDDKCKIMNKKGRFLSDIYYDKIEINAFNIIECTQNEYKGYVDRNKDKISLCLYEKIETIETDFKYNIIAYKGGRCGIISINKVIVPFDYETIMPVSVINGYINKFGYIEKGVNVKFAARYKGRYVLIDDRGFVCSDYIYLPK